MRRETTARIWFGVSGAVTLLIAFSLPYPADAAMPRDLTIVVAGLGGLSSATVSWFRARRGIGRTHSQAAQVAAASIGLTIASATLYLGGEFVFAFLCFVGFGLVGLGVLGGGAGLSPPVGGAE